MNTKLEQVLKAYENRIKTGAYVKTFFQKVKDLPKRFFKKKPDGGEQQL